MPRSGETPATPKAWPFEEAAKVAARLARSGRQAALFETGYGPSGLPHIGTFGEIARTSWVRHAFTELTGLPSRLISSRVVAVYCRVASSVRITPISRARVTQPAMSHFQRIATPRYWETSGMRSTSMAAMQPAAEAVGAGRHRDRQREKGHTGPHRAPAEDDLEVVGQHQEHAEGADDGDRGRQVGAGP